MTEIDTAIGYYELTQLYPYTTTRLIPQYSPINRAIENPLCLQ